jgi:2'-5' RNA ligase
VRLFIALEIPSAVRRNLASLIADLRALDDSASKNKSRWVRPENLHVTLKFIGNVDPSRLDQIQSMLADIPRTEEISLHLHGVGFFPNSKRPRVFWAGIESSPSLSQLANLIDKRLEEIGVPRETRGFAPHLTLARFDPPGISDPLRLAAEQHAGTDFGTLHTREFHLFESKTRPTGAEYTRLSSFPVAKAEA